jgi:hypothetical protein
MPASMVSLDFFAECYGWEPGTVRTLTLAELYWLPIVRQARVKADAIRARHKQGPGRG